MATTALAEIYSKFPSDIYGTVQYCTLGRRRPGREGQFKGYSVQHKTCPPPKLLPCCLLDMFNMQFHLRCPHTHTNIRMFVHISHVSDALSFRLALEISRRWPVSTIAVINIGNAIKRVRLKKLLTFRMSKHR